MVYVNLDDCSSFVRIAEFIVSCRVIARRSGWLPTQGAKAEPRVHSAKIMASRSRWLFVSYRVDCT